MSHLIGVLHVTLTFSTVTSHQLIVMYWLQKTGKHVGLMRPCKIEFSSLNYWSNFFSLSFFLTPLLISSFFLPFVPLYFPQFFFTKSIYLFIYLFTYLLTYSFIGGLFNNAASNQAARRRMVGLSVNLKQGCTDPGSQVAVATNFCMLALLCL